MPIVLFTINILNLLQAIRCQTSAQYSFLKYGKAEKRVDLDFSGDEGLMYFLTSTLLSWETDTDSCLAVDMIPDSQLWKRRGSLSLLWPFFQALCLGQFVETLTCALQGRHVMTETGMSIFEHSLAFAEAEGMLGTTLGLSPFGGTMGRLGGTKFSAETSDIFTRNALFYQLNTPPEVLLLALISALNNLTSQILGALNLQNRFRLLNTGFWGFCFLGAFIQGFLSMRLESENAMLRIPTVCIIGFIPHLLIVLGMLLCTAIYGLALILSLVSPQTDPSPRGFRERFRMARQNLQANGQFSNIRFNMHEDFYTALLKVGVSTLTVASEAVYLNEGQRITVAPMTWLEEERIQEIESLEDGDDLSVRIENPGREKVDFSTNPELSKSGYSRQMAITAAKSTSKRRYQADGVGHLQRGGRYIMAFEYFDKIFRLLILEWLKLLTSKLLHRIGLKRRPQWLRSARHKADVEKRMREQADAQFPPLEFWLLSDDGVLSLPENDNIDVGEETRRRLLAAAENEFDEVPDDNKLDRVLYDWWKNNGWWGEKDESGTYAPSHADENDNDLTSIISSTATSDYGSDNNDDDRSGRSTPTQRRPHPRSSTPQLDSFTDHALDPSHLARLLNPSDPAARAEAAMLAHHLTSEKITTRSSYSTSISSGAARLVTSTHLRPPGSTVPVSSSSRCLTKQEEAQLLEEMILFRRHRNTSRADPSDSAPGILDSSGTPSSGVSQCVVCQSSPRSVLLWPCRCLSLCEECRVSLAMNNFGTCVCCRRDVVGFSRLFVP